MRDLDTGKGTPEGHDPGDLYPIPHLQCSNLFVGFRRPGSLQGETRRQEGRYFTLGLMKSIR